MKNVIQFSLLSALVATTLGSCALPTREDVSANLPGNRATTETRHMQVKPEVTEPKLYARDGGVVNGPGPGAVTQGSPRHEAREEEGTRMYLLELYQKAIDEKEQLELEVRSLTMSLEKSNAKVREGEATQTELEKRISELEQERKGLREDNLELAGRLTTAQIRRLQAEKLLIEAKLEWKRMEKMTGVQPANSAGATPGVKPEQKP